MTELDRRTFLTRGALVAGAATFASGPLAGILARAAGAAPGTCDSVRRARRFR